MYVQCANSMEDCECSTAACFYLRKSLPALRTLIQESGICCFLLQDKPLLDDLRVILDIINLCLYFCFLRI